MSGGNFLDVLPDPPCEARSNVCCAHQDIADLADARAGR
jgi:hypothetical protein